MADPEGTDGEGTGCNGWFFVETIVEKKTGDVISDDEDETATDTGSDMVDFIDTQLSICEQAEQETAQALFHAQEVQNDAQVLHLLKRKFAGGSKENSPLGEQLSVDTDLSPRLREISLNSGHKKAKRRLFTISDSGYGCSEVEAAETQVTVNTNAENGGSVHSTQSSGGDSSDNAENVDPHCSITELKELLQASNKKAAMLAVFKDIYGLSFTDLVRNFKSDKTTCTDWVMAIFGVNPTVAEGFKTLIKPATLYAHIQCLDCKWGVLILALLRYKCGKNRLTVAKGLSTLLHVPETCMLIEPPKLRSSLAALYWYRTGISNISEVSGDTPEWIQRLTIIQHGIDDSNFDLSDMVQWAFDNDLTDESDMAFQYAQLADCNSNAAAFLKSNCQAKYLKDCAVMCRHYKRAQKRQMNMSQWIKYRCSKIDEGGDWRPIVQFLRYQGVEFISFLRALKEFLKGTPKKNCILLYGPANTGKSYFGMSFIHFLQGAIISFVNSNSHFWLEPLADTKVAMLDDATHTCWTYFDNYMRNALDGNPISIDRKHKPLLQLKCPPILLTSNIDPAKDNKWPYLESRVTVFTFPHAFPFDKNGNPVYEINDKNWKCFFERTWSRLDLHEDDEDADTEGIPFGTFKCVTGQNTRPL
uniref:Replication protein E1 n=1 Tax=Human papillomavirus 45 TaxID=10593 RepID=T2A7A1_HPV45|nr:E1 [human papillomavirus 45]